ncbi:MAG TPA: hypothetical protein VF531_11340 [Bacillota bacterium]
MYIIGYNRTNQFYFISKEEQRARLEASGVQVLTEEFAHITSAAAALRELNHETSKR